MKKVLLLLSSITMVACGNKNNEIDANTKNEEAVKTALVDNVSKNFNIDANKVKIGSSQDLPNKWKKYIAGYENNHKEVTFGLIDTMGKKFSMFAGNTILNDLTENKDKLNIESVEYPKREFHSDIALKFDGVKLVVRLKDDTEEKRSEVLNYLKNKYNDDFENNIYFNKEDVQLNPEQAIWLD